MTKLRIVSVIAMLFAFGAVANAQNHSVEGANAGSSDARPTRGMTQASVQSKYGSPASVKAPVGDPPISRWEYADFVVFFEHDKVIHAVVKR